MTDIHVRNINLILNPVIHAMFYKISQIIPVIFISLSVTVYATADSPKTTTVTTPVTEPANVRVRLLADTIWADMLENSTYLRLQEGLPIEKFERHTLAKHREDLAKLAAWKRQLSDIEADNLHGDDLITYEILAFELEDTGANDDDYWLQFDITPYVGFRRFHFAHEALVSKKITNRKSADQYLKLLEDYAVMVAELKTKVIGQMGRGIYLPKPALASARATWDRIKVTIPTSLSVTEDRLAGLSDAEKSRFTEKVTELIANRITAEFNQLLALLGKDYERKAPDTVGISQYPGGRAVYKRLAHRHTTLDLSIEEIHERGGKAVAEVSAHMKNIQAQLGFKGTTREFHEKLRQDNRFIAKTPADVEARYQHYIRKIEPELSRYFKSKPKAAYGVRRLPLEAEPGMTYGYYTQPTVNEPLGYYNYNGSDLKNRSLIVAGSLIYHELLPGHHFHLASQGENENLQDFRKKYSVGAFTEGWAEYAASLGIEMGMYDESLYDLYGRYVMEIFLASRLVVDTGMNALGWSLQEARDFMSEYLYNSEVEIASETLRYSTSIPAQALAYRIGYEKFWELRKRTEKMLGDKFDVRGYHDLVLADGAKPLTALEAKVERYIKSNLLK